jgi:hypothetical protein
MRSIGRQHVANPSIQVTATSTLAAIASTSMIDVTESWSSAQDDVVERHNQDGQPLSRHSV